MLDANKLLLQSSLDGGFSGKAEGLDRFYLTTKTLLSPALVQVLAPQRLKASEARPVEEPGFALLAWTPASVTCEIQQSPQQASPSEGKAGSTNRIISLALCRFRR